MTDTILKARGLSRQFNSFYAVKDVDLDVREGTIHALIGPNGAGKTTCFNLLTKFLTPTAGQLDFAQRDITHMAPADVARLGMVRSFQISAVFAHLSVLENVRIALQRRRGSSFDFWRGEGLLRRLDDEARALLARVGLEQMARRHASELSYGHKRALEIATTLALDPKLMLLDEPMAGMGHEEIGRITDLIQEISVGRTILMVEHNLSVVERLAHRITVLARGSVLAEGDFAAISQDPRVIEAYIGGTVA